MPIDTQPVKRYGRANLGPGLTMWRKVRATLDWPGEIPYVVHMTAALHDGRIQAESVTVEQREKGPPVTGEALRSLQVASLLRSVVLDRMEVQEASARLMQSEPAAIKGKGKTDEALAAVSLAYRVAFLCGEAPRKKVQEMLDVSRATASRWITAAVERGHLDAALARRTLEED
ncbi:MAG: hypothetical protein H0U89_10785 [Acidimicrobiia bacterium]|nr:hypothetical protein [Acidimicrobiia bacterium]